MPQVSPKGCLPFGWIVKPSKHYPDRIYYFNVVSGESTWECPILDPPRVLSENETESRTIMKDSPKSRCEPKNPPPDINRGVRVCEEKSTPPGTNSRVKVCEEKSTPPTAVVVPVVQKQKENPVLSTEKKKKKKKKKSRVNHEEPDVPKLNEGSNKKRKLSEISSDDTNCHGKDGPRSSSTEKEKNVSHSSAGTSSGESNLKDVEMQDVSMDLLDDLAEKKETVFDTTACYYIVVDTNVLIGEIQLINELKDTPLDGCGPPHIFIPWVVIEELDKLKSQRNTNKSAQRQAAEAIRYLNSVLSKHPRFHGQSPVEAEEWAKTYSKCNDDKILECCMALKDKMPAEKVILLTNDKNLVNKALICKINVHNFESLMKKVKPDTVFDYEKIKTNKKKKKEKDGEELQNPVLSSDSLKEQMLLNKRDDCKREIHSIMSNARLLLKNVLYKFFIKEMNEAYGDVWRSFKIEVHLLENLLKSVKRYWIAVFSLFFTEKDKRNFELLHEKASRPEGFLGIDKDECLVILSAIEDVFRPIQKRQPTLRVPTKEIQDYRVACVNAFAAFSDAESSLRVAEENSIRSLLDAVWTAINQLSGMILDYFRVPHTFDYEKSRSLTDFEVQSIMTVLYPGVELIRNLLRSIRKGLENNKPVKSSIKKLATALLDFIPSFGLPYEHVEYPFFTAKALGKFLTCPQNREMLDVGIEQIENFHNKLHEALRIMLLPHLRNKSPEPETMICD